MCVARRVAAMRMSGDIGSRETGYLEHGENCRSGAGALAIGRAILRWGLRVTLVLLCLGFALCRSLLGMVPSDQATSTGAEHAMMASHVPGQATHCGSLEAALGVRGRGDSGQSRQGQSRNERPVRMVYS